MNFQSDTVIYKIINISHHVARKTQCHSKPEYSKRNIYTLNMYSTKDNSVLN